MAPRSPNRSIDQFVRAVSGHTERFNATTDLVTDSGGGRGYTELRLRRGLAVDYFFRVATDWQVFQDNWSIGAIAHKPAGMITAYQRKLAKDVAASDATKTLGLFTDVKFTVPSLGTALTTNQVRSILDSQGRNVEFATSQMWADWAKKHLAEPHKGTLLRLLADDEVASLLDWTRQLRNYIAHRSEASLAEISQHAARRSPGGTVGLVGSLNEPLMFEGKKRMRDIGTYLDRGLGYPLGTPALNIRRRLVSIAESLRW